MTLSHVDHDRDAAGMTYVYPVVSRRARGVSIGVNLNPNNACNWRCVYCQVPGLVAGRAPHIDLAQLDAELARMLALACDDEWLERNVPAGSRRVVDIAFAGNGEPTSSMQLEEALEIAAQRRRAAGLESSAIVRLITNGSLTHREHVQSALRALAAMGGEAWCKLDAGDDAGLKRLNSVRTGIERARRNLEHCARACPTWVQTMALDWNGSTLAGDALERYVDVLCSVLDSGASLRGVLLYGMARPSHQSEAAQLRALPAEELERIAARIRERSGLEVRVSE